MAIQNLYPAIRPSLDLNFAGSKTVDPRITFTRESSATYFNEFGVLRTASNNVPRIDNNPITGECLGLLIEEQRTNLLTYSEQFNNAAWQKSESSIAANVAISPDGSMNADKLTESTASNRHFIYQNIIVTSGTSYTVSVFVKSAERSAIRIDAGDGEFGVGNYADFNLSSKTATPFGNCTAGVIESAQGYLRCYCTFIAINSASAAFTVELRNNASVYYAGDGTSGIYIWGAQIEAGAFPTSYIKTEASQMTRTADSAAMTGTNFSSWYRQDEGTMVAEINDLRIGSGITSNAGIFDVRQSAGDAANTRTLRAMSGGNGALVLQISDANGVAYSPANKEGGALTSVNQFGKVGLAYKWGDDAVASEMGLLSANRTLVGAAPLVASVLYIGSLNNGSQFQSTRHVKRLAYYPRRLSNAQLGALTS